MAEVRLTFKEMCARFDVTPRTLRYYDYVELLHPERVGRSRFYGAREIARMTLIRRARSLDFALEDIRRWLAIYDESGPKAQMAEAIRKIDGQIGTLRERRAEIDAILENLAELRHQILVEMA